MNSRIERLSLDDKIELLSGQSFWSTQENKKIDLRSLFLADGPHGLRKQEGENDHLGLNASIKTTCFPTASHLASTWNTKLLNQVGDALAKEAQAIGIDIILGPGINMKRNPLCGRNFEYFSEDPLLTGLLASNWVTGVQKNKIGTSLKHFALNNQETERFVTNAIVDERTLHEYYLAAFRKVVKTADPYTVMCSYNKFNGQQVSYNKKLLTNILRNDWGYKGLVVSDWGATCNRPLSIKAGMDLEMPSSENFFKKDIKRALKNNDLTESDINLSVSRLLELESKIIKPIEINKSDLNQLFSNNAKLALKAAQEGGILLKNEEALPLSQTNSFKVVGALADDFRFQGSGSSQVSPVMKFSILDGLENYKINYQYYPGYELNDVESKNIEEDALNSIKSDDTVIFCMGLTPVFESEGYDREHLKLPTNQIRLLEKIIDKTKNIIVVLVGGAPFEITFDQDVKAILHMQLSGQMGGQAAVDLLFGNVNPSGKLAETYPLKYEDLPNEHIYNKVSKNVPYLEGQYCGYRYFNTAGVNVKYPFGFGLSYSKFDYSNLMIKLVSRSQATIQYSITNTSAIDGAETSQVYMSLSNPSIHRPKKVLVGFNKTMIKAGTTVDVETTIDFEPLQIWDKTAKCLKLETGNYQIEVSSNIEEPKLMESIELVGVEFLMSEKSWYTTFENQVTEKDFKSEFLDFDQYYQSDEIFSTESSIMELKDYSYIAGKIFDSIEKQNAKQFGGEINYENPEYKMLMSASTCTPLRAMSLFSPKVFSRKLNSILIKQANKNKRKKKRTVQTSIDKRT